MRTAIQAFDTYTAFFRGVTQDEAPMCRIHNMSGHDFVEPLDVG